MVTRLSLASPTHGFLAKLFPRCPHRIWEVEQCINQYFHSYSSIYMGHNNSNMRKKEIVARDARGCSGRIGSRPIWPKVNRGTEVEVIMPAICSKNLRKLILSSKNLHDICLQCATGTSFETFFFLVFCANWLLDLHLSCLDGGTVCCFWCLFRTWIIWWEYIPGSAILDNLKY